MKTRIYAAPTVKGLTTTRVDPQTRSFMIPIIALPLSPNSHTLSTEQIRRFESWKNSAAMWEENICRCNLHKSDQTVFFLPLQIVAAISDLHAEQC